MPPGAAALATGAIVGIIIGSLVLVGLIVAGVYFVVCRRRAAANQQLTGMKPTTVVVVGNSLRG